MKPIINYILNTTIVLALLVVGNMFYQQVVYAYIQYADISNFYENTEFFVENICVGDMTQNVLSTRFVYGTEIGYQATVVRELFLIERGLQTKILDERSTPFIEFTETGIVTRVQNLPPDLIVGDYQWVLKISLIIKDVVRDDVPLIKSNIFQVIDCK